MVDFIEEEITRYTTDEAKNLRSEIKSMESFMDYLQYEILCLQKKRAEKVKEYQKILGLEVKDGNTETKA